MLLKIIKILRQLRSEKYREKNVECPLSFRMMLSGPRAAWSPDVRNDSLESAALSLDSLQENKRAEDSA